MRKVAFRCKNCGRLHTSDSASEALHPHACEVCGCGVSFHPRTGVKTIDPDNWEHLHEATHERLAELGITHEHVETHTPWKSDRTEKEAFPKHIQVNTEDGPGTKDTTS